ncbi:cytochrome c oxidase subunit 6b-1-like [Hordeum vulgare]|nr:cytochrome c oxidase subunit 6b-1-like [Hordeum vulgare]
MEEAAEEQAAAPAAVEFGDAAENGMEEEGASASAGVEEDAAAAEAAAAAYSCVSAKGDEAAECDKFAKYYRSLCPAEWVDKWNEQRENGTFAGPL